MVVKIGARQQQILRAVLEAHPPAIGCREILQRPGWGRLSLAAADRLAARELLIRVTRGEGRWRPRLTDSRDIANLVEYLSRHQDEAVVYLAPSGKEDELRHLANLQPRIPPLLRKAVYARLRRKRFTWRRIKGGYDVMVRGHHVATFKDTELERFRSVTWDMLRGKVDAPRPGLGPRQREVLRLLGESGPMRRRDIVKVIPAASNALDRLVRRGLVVRLSEEPRRAIYGLKE